jgi:hypothetical protein
MPEAVPGTGLNARESGDASFFHIAKPRRLRGSNDLPFEGRLCVSAIPTVEGKEYMSSKFEVSRSENGGCFICSDKGEDLYLAREISSGKLLALCSCCLLMNIDAYMIDNTREWPVKCERKV